MKKVTQTINPLHFEDLDPNRFEDLVRQLIYDLKNWESLEATGRSGADEGFDIRGIENYLDEKEFPEDKGENEEDNTLKNINGRVWLIQCKREKSITPKKIEKYLNNIFEHNHDLYGFIFVAPCNFSKKTRDTLINIIRENNVKEFRIFGNSELEDMLFQPKNDHLLFAYFGFSLAIRRRSNKTKIRTRISIKNKVTKILGEMSQYNVYQPCPVLLRDISDEIYPYSSEILNFDQKPTWGIYTFQGYSHNGPVFLVKEFYAYYDYEKNEIDALNLVNITNPSFDDPWKVGLNEDTNIEAVKKIWDSIPEKNRGFLIVTAVVNFDRILAIDEKGDNIFGGPHFFIEWSNSHGPFEEYYIYKVKNLFNEYIDFNVYEANRIKYFPLKYRKEYKRT